VWLASLFLEGRPKLSANNRILSWQQTQHRAAHRSHLKSSSPQIFISASPSERDRRFDLPIDSRQGSPIYSPRTKSTGVAFTSGFQQKLFHV
jgi:hypothetical protein